jgi:hypothetical protein
MPAIVHPDSTLRKRYADYLGIQETFYPDIRLEQLGRNYGIDVVLLGPSMQRHADATGEFLHGFPKGKRGFGHWNEAGHALAASLIGRHLCQR